MIVAVHTSPYVRFGVPRVPRAPSHRDSLFRLPLMLIGGLDRIHLPAENFRRRTSQHKTTCSFFASQPRFMCRSHSWMYVLFRFFRLSKALMVFGQAFTALVDVKCK